MKKIILFLLAISSLVYAKVNTVVSILPQKTFVEAIGGDKVNVSLMVKPGNTPHTYEPKPSQMRDIAKAKLYFSIGVEFEEIWLPKFANQNKNLMIVDISKGIVKIEMEAHSHGDEEEHHDHDHGKHDDHDEHDHEDHGKHKDHDDHDKHEHEKHAKHDDHDEHEEEHHHDHDGLDPHVWTSPENAKVLAKNILRALVKADKANEVYYVANYEKLLSKIKKTDKEIKDILKDTPKGAHFMIFHPAWGYFAKQYSLTQLPIEVSGKNPKPKQMMHIIEEAKEEKVRAVFTNPEVSDATAKLIAKELNVPVVKISPLSPNWSENLINFAKAIANK